jgi:hypothetical protein
VTPAQRRALARLERQVRETAPDIATALLKAVRELVRSVPVAAIERAMLRGGAAEVIREFFSDAALDTAMAPARAELLAAVQKAGNGAWRNVIPVSVAGGFDILDPRVLSAVQTMTTQALSQFRRDIQDSIRAEAERGLLAGVGPRETARRIRGAVGLAPNQSEAVSNFRAALENATGDKKALGYGLRDRRFDATLRAARSTGVPLTPEQVGRMTDRYRDRMLAFHAETIARTTALDAQKLGQQLAIEQAADAGLVDTGRLVKRWVATQDERTREAHREMDGVEVPYDEPWIVPDAGPQMYPGDGEYNCRCTAVYRLIPRAQAA